MTRCFYCLLLLAIASSTSGADWPQWLGPQRDSVWREDGIVSKFPTDGLPVKWRVPVGLGYSGPAVTDGRVYVLDYGREEGTVANGPANCEGMNELHVSTRQAANRSGSTLMSDRMSCRIHRALAVRRRSTTGVYTLLVRTAI